jgi:hypothetical protein
MPLPLWQYTSGTLASQLREVDRAADGPVYVTGLHLSSAVDIDPRWSTIELHWDTETRYEKRAGENPPQPWNARWAFKHFLSSERRLWDARDDPQGHEALESWARDEELWYEGDPLDKSDAQIEREIELYERIVNALVATVRDLHEAGTIASIFGRGIPMLIEPQDSHDPYPAWNEQANPPELYAQFGPYLESIWSPG